MKAKDAKCKYCGGAGKLYGSDHTDTEGPFFVACERCGAEATTWALPREAWKAWKMMNVMVCNSTIVKISCLRINGKK